MLSGVEEAIRMLNRAGLLVMVVTNQSAIARGLLTPETLEHIHQKMRRAFRRSGAWVDAIYVCPHHPDEGCACRKPGTAMFEQAAKEWNLSLPDSYVVGDRQLDILSGRAVGSKAILVRSGHGPEPSSGVAADYEAATLFEAARWILHQEGLSPARSSRRISGPHSSRQMAV